jgi:hypothetical protein
MSCGLLAWKLISIWSIKPKIRTYHLVLWSNFIGEGMSIKSNPQGAQKTDHQRKEVAGHFKRY